MVNACLSLALLPALSLGLLLTLIINSIGSFWGGGRGVGVESGGDLCIVRVIKFNVIYYKCLSLAPTLVLALSPN